jgi:hypothetical protein
LAIGKLFYLLLIGKQISLANTRKKWKIHQGKKFQNKQGFEARVVCKSIDGQVFEPESNCVESFGGMFEEWMED